MDKTQDLSNYSPYCKECSACREPGCCPVYMCQMTDHCEYKETYLTELKEHYSLVEEFYKKIYRKLPQDLKEEWDVIEKTNWEYWYGKDRVNS